MIPTTTRRVMVNTNPRLNDSISERTRDRVAHYASATPQMLEQRLSELHHEWDVERITATVLALSVLGGVLLVSQFGALWLIVPFLCATFLLLHGVVGWWPLLPLLRWCGCRTAPEIAHERYALKALRGDFLTKANTKFIVLHQHETLPHGIQILQALESANLEPRHIDDLVEGARKATVLYLRMAEWALRPDSLSSLADGSADSAISIDEIQRIAEFDESELAAG